MPTRSPAFRYEKARSRWLWGLLLVLVLLLSSWNWGLGWRRKHTQAVVTKEAPSAKPPKVAVETGRTANLVPASLERRTVQALTGVNAADLYKNAFVLWEALSEEERTVAGKPFKAASADDAAAIAAQGALFAKLQPIMALLRQAQAEAAYCDWGFGPVHLDTPRRHLMEAIRVGKAVQWEAGYQFQTYPSGALADLDAEMALAHSVEESAVIGFAVSASMNQGAIGIMREQAGGMSPEDLETAAKMVQAYDPTDVFAKSMESECGALRLLAADLENPETQAKTLALLAGVLDSSEKPTPEKERLQLMTFPQQVEKIVQRETELIGKTSASDADFNAWWADVEAEAKGEPLMALMIPAWSRIREMVRAAAVNQAMMLVGLGVLQGGAERASAVPDPTTGAAFHYVPLPEGGFELRSNFVSKGKPVVMRFGGN